VAVSTSSASDLILQKIKELPPLPLVVQKLIKVMDDERSSADDISRVLSSDQAMATKVLKLVNSSFYGLSGQVSTVSRAVVILGVAAIRNLAMGLAVAKIMARGDQDTVQKLFWEHALATAASCEVLARATGYPDPEEAFIAGLLHDIGHLVFLMAVPTEFHQLVEDGPGDLVEMEKTRIGMSHAQAGQKILKHWKLPRALEQAVRFHHSGPTITSHDAPLVSLAALGDTLAGAFGGRFENTGGEGDFPELVKVTGLDLASLPEMLAAIGQRVTETRLFLQIASDGAVDLEAEEELPRRRVVLISTERTRTQWTQQLLTVFGHQLVPMKDFFAAAAEGDLPDAVLLDPASVTADQLLRMKPVLAMMGPRLALLGPDQDGAVSCCLGRSFRRLAVGFSRQELESLLSDQV
jgi:HD-like signal output (HDOD) protein